MKVWLIRHGATRLSEEKRYQGSNDEGLSAKGRAALLRADFAPQRVYVSPMRRAKETAAILFPNAENCVVPDFREMDFGAFEGRGWWEMEDDPAYRAWIESGCESRCPGGEARADFSARVCGAFAELLRKETELVIVAHGGTQMAVLERWASPKRIYYECQRPCGCGWLLRYEKERDRLRVLRELDFLR